MVFELISDAAAAAAAAAAALSSIKSLTAVATSAAIAVVPPRYLVTAVEMPSAIIILSGTNISIHYMILHDIAIL